MAISDQDIAFAVELFSPLGGITKRKMMGGLCLYQDGTIFAMVHSGGQIYLKAQGGFIAELDAAGCTQWTYSRDGGPERGMPYWTFPTDALDDPEAACDWARKALAVL